MDNIQDHKLCSCMGYGRMDRLHKIMSIKRGEWPTLILSRLDPQNEKLSNYKVFIYFYNRSLIEKCLKTS